MDIPQKNNRTNIIYHIITMMNHILKIHQSTYTGWWFQPLLKILVSWDYCSQDLEKWNSYSKPTTSMETAFTCWIINYDLFTCVSSRDVEDEHVLDHDPTPKNTSIYIYWLVVYLPLWKMMDFVSWDYYSQYIYIHIYMYIIYTHICILYIIYIHIYTYIYILYIFIYIWKNNPNVPNHLCGPENPSPMVSQSRRPIWVNCHSFDGLWIP